MIKKIIFKLARKKSFGKIIGLSFAYFSAFIPLKKLINNSFALSFYHPVPFYKQHILIVPKKVIPSILKVKNTLIFEEIANIAIELAKNIGWYDNNIILCANGGNRQDVMQLHFHLFSAKSFLKHNPTDICELPTTLKGRGF